MDYHSLYQTLRYVIECRACRGTGQGKGVDPCSICIGSGVEGISKDEKLVESRALEGLKTTPEQIEILREV